MLLMEIGALRLRALICTRLARVHCCNDLDRYQMDKQVLRSRLYLSIVFTLRSVFTFVDVDTEFTYILTDIAVRCRVMSGLALTLVGNF